MPARAPSLLAYLILRPGTAQPRQRIAQLLWPESTDGQARTNLRNVLHHLRRSAPRLAGCVEIPPAALRWRGDPGCRVDVIEFVAALDAAAVALMPYVAVQSLQDGGAPPGRHYYWKAHRLPDLTNEVIDIFVASMATATSPFAMINGWAIGGAVCRVDPAATAIADREPGFEMSITVGWPPSDEDSARHVAWMRGTWEARRPYGAGVYANFISDEGDAGVAYAYGEHLGRLRALKAVHDPDNFFRLNNNITPPADAGVGARGERGCVCGKPARPGRATANSPRLRG